MNTKLDTWVIVLKCACYVTIGFFMPLTTGLAQWVNSGEFPGKLIWIVMAASCCVGAASQLLSFLSGSYSDYKAKVADAAGNVPGPIAPSVPQTKP